MAVDGQRMKKKQDIMTDRQIIIDGVDVNGCEYIGLYKECKLKCGSCYPVDCSDNPNCYYKQLKAKEQECWDLKSVRYSWISKCEQEIKTSEFFQDVLADFKAENEKLKQAFGEIKEIAEADFNHTCWETYARQLKQILQKISECGVDLE